MLSLEILICTYRPEGIERVAAMRLPRLDGVRWLVSWQAHGDAPVPAALQREDVTVVRYDGTGLARNCNNALEHATGDILLRADDDVEYYPEALQEIRRIYTDHPDVEMALFRFDSDVAKIYPPEETPLSRPVKGWYVSSIEISVRRDSRAGRLRFDPRFGLNAPYLGCAEDDVYILDARRAGVNARFYPISICRHIGESTGVQTAYNASAVRAWGGYIRLAYPLWQRPLRYALRAWRLYRSRGHNPLTTLADLLRGSRYVRTTPR